MTCLGATIDTLHAHDFYVIGLALPEPATRCLSASFPQCILYTAAPELPEQTRALCDFLGKVVIFTYIPAIPDRMWLRASALFHEAAVKVIGVHPYCTDEIFDRALEAEFAGVIDAHADTMVFRSAALSVQRAELWFPRGYLSRRIRQSASTTSSGGLSDREEEILALLGSGVSNQGIADRLFISRDTVRWHLRSIYAKLGVSDRQAAHRLATNKLTSSSRRPLQPLA